MRNVAPLVGPFVGPLVIWGALAGATLASLALASRCAAPGPAVMAALLVASFAASVGGFAFSAIGSVLLLRLAGDPVAVVQLLVTCSIAIQCMATWSLRREIAWRPVAMFLLGGLAGLPFGVWLLLHGGRVGVRPAFGVAMLAAGILLLWRRPTVPPHAMLDLLAGFLGGITGGALGFPSAPVGLWCSLKRWDKVRERAAIQPFVLVMQLSTMALIGVWRAGASGPPLPGPPLSGPSWTAGVLLCIPVCLCGTLAGLACFRRLAAARRTVPLDAAIITSGLAYVV